MSDKKTDVIFDKAVFGGYDTTQVDEFVEEARKLLSSQKKENEVLKQKLTILADKIEEYRSAENKNPSPAVAQPAEAEVGEAVSAAQSDVIVKYETVLASLKAKISEAKTELEALLREKTLLASSLAAQYEQCLNVMRAEPTVILPEEPAASVCIPAEPDESPVIAAEPADIAKPVIEEEPVFEETDPVAEPLAESSENDAEKTTEEMPVAAIDIELPDGEPESPMDNVPSIAETVEAGESVYLNADPEEMAKLSYEEALAMVLKKNGILRTAAPVAQPQPAMSDVKAEETKTEETKEVPAVREDLQNTKIIPRMQMTSAVPTPAVEKTEKKKKEHSFFGGIRKSIHNFLEDESDDDVYPLGNNTSDKTSELKFGKAYNVKNDQ